MYTQEHAEWKHTIQPWKSDDEIKKSCHNDLKAIELGFPGIQDKKTVLALAADLVYTCDIDDIIEELDPVSAEYCISRCVAILEGRRDSSVSSRECSLQKSTELYLTQLLGTNDSRLQRAEDISASYHQLLNKLFHASVAKKILEDIQSMVAGQLPEKTHNHTKEPLQNFTQYLDLRERPLGVRPLLTIVEQYCFSNEEFLRNDPRIETFKDKIVRLTIVQNDLGGIEKDLTTRNRSNAVVALYELGENCQDPPRDIDSISKNLELATNWHNRLLEAVVEAYMDTKKEGYGDRVNKFIDMGIALCVTHLRWTLSTQRYSIDQKNKE